MQPRTKRAFQLFYYVVVVLVSAFLGTSLIYLLFLLAFIVIPPFYVALVATAIALLAVAVIRWTR